jgi:hypothetical protein
VYVVVYQEMGKEIISVHVGQCGCQIAQSLWTSLSGRGNDEPLFDPMSGYARSVLVDMEERVVDRLTTSRNEIFDPFFVLKNQPGSGNNWARGFHEHACNTSLGEEAMELLRKQLEFCDSCDSILFFGSSSGGTGSGFGSFLVEESHAVFPNITRIVFPVTGGRDVVTGSYNTVLSVSKWLDHSSMVVPISNTSPNSSIASFVSTILYQHSPRSPISDLCKTIVLRENLKIAIPAFASVPPDSFVGVAKHFDTKFGELFKGRHRLLTVTERVKAKTASIALVVETSGNVITEKDIDRNVESGKRLLATPQSKQKGGKPACMRDVLWTKTGPNTEQAASISMLHNTSAIKSVLKDICSEPESLLRRKAHLHHYTEWIDAEDIREAIHRVRLVAKQYNSL